MDWIITIGDRFKTLAKDQNPDEGIFRHELSGQNRFYYCFQEWDSQNLYLYAIFLFYFLNFYYTFWLLSNSQGIYKPGFSFSAITPGSSRIYSLSSKSLLHGLNSSVGKINSCGLRSFPAFKTHHQMAEVYN